MAVRGLGGRRSRVYPSTESLLAAVAAGEVAAGYVVSTRGSWLVSTRWRDRLRLLPAAGSPDSFPICAAVRKSDGDLREAIDHAWEDLTRSGRLSRAFERWGIEHQPATPAEAEHR